MEASGGLRGACLPLNFHHCGVRISHGFQNVACRLACHYSIIKALCGIINMVFFSS